ncbi:nucleotide-diphospho-sugar transferase [Pyronema omphalodes]|nr:nucleotide-diphospho-sugar transferase [Pyronema omphalodes]
MRRGVALFLLINFLILGYILNSVFTLITLLFEDCKADAILSSEIPAPGSELIGKGPQYIPRIIHQTWANESIPEKWQKAQKSCLDLHGDYEYKLWTNEKSRDFIEKEYPWFLETFDNYPYPIMRADAIRYFILSHYGGIYLDLDDGCERRLDPLLSYHAWLRKTVPTGISNDAMGSVPQHPFFLKVISELQRYNRNWQIPYVTVMYNTGPLFLSVIWKQYIKTVSSEEQRVRILMPDEYGNKPWKFFGVYKGSSWHRDDAKAIFWMGQHWGWVTFAGFALGLSGYAAVYLIYRRLHLKRSGEYRTGAAGTAWSFWPWRSGYRRVKHEV